MTNTLKNTLKVDINDSNNKVTLTLTGPKDVWYGFGFNAQKMVNLPYVIYVDGYGNVHEQKLANHAPGSELKTTISVLSHSIDGDLRTVIVERDIKGLNE